MRSTRKVTSEATERLVGRTIRIHGGKVEAVVHEAASATAVIIDYDTLLDPQDKRTRVTGRQLVTLEELQHPEMIGVNKFRHLFENKDRPNPSNKS